MIARLALLVTLFAAIAAGDEPAARQRRGEHLFRTGEPLSGRKVTALLGGDDLEVPATVVPCGSCHGPDGRGLPDAAIRPANIRWNVLTQPLATERRNRPPYTRSLVKRAITMGLDSGGQKLESTMPRYRLTLEDMDDLLAYLRQLDDAATPAH
ncbi:MAG TPA: cytochrome c [Thermoanaerobaculia bacterium]